MPDGYFLGIFARSSTPLKRGLMVANGVGIIDADYGSGVSMSWYVEGLANRLGFGPTSPWMGDLPVQRTSGHDMQRLFEGRII